MSKFHSTVTRREFMKALGLAGAGLGAAAAAAPVFHDLDEVAASPGAEWKRPWYVKHVDKPTVEIDWSLMQRLDQRLVNTYMPGQSNNDSPEMVDIDYRCSMRNNVPWPIETQWAKEHFYPEWEGTTIRDQAMRSGAGGASCPYSPGYGAAFMGPQRAKTPEQLGMTPWQGTPEENLRMIRAAFKTFGAASVGCFELDQNTKKIIFTYQQQSGEPTEQRYVIKIVRNKRYEFEDVDQAYFTDEKLVIPNKARYMIVWTTLMTPELTLREGSQLGWSSTILAYNRSSFINTHLLEFMRTLGYNACCAYRSCMSPAAPRGLLSGIDEHCRMCLPNINSEFGSCLRTVNGIVTDLPLAPTKPVDAGVFRFCRTCGICANFCPFGGLPKGDPSWESEYTDHSIHAGNTPGYEGYRMDVTHCTKCGVCQGSCPFNTTEKSIIHSLVRPTIATTSLFNSFFANMEDTFGYGIKNPETWWEMKDYPVFGIEPEFLKK